MKKIIITLFLIAGLNSILEFFLPWYVLSVVCFGICYIARLSRAQSFFAGFIGIALSWLILILLKDIPNQHILSGKMANLFPFGGNYVYFIVFSTLIGALIGGLSGLCGRMFNGSI